MPRLIMALTGDLHDFDLTSLVQLLSMKRQSGLLRIANHDETGNLYLISGQIVHAELGELSGEEVAYTICGWSEGIFEFQTGIPAPMRSVVTSNDSLLIEALRRNDELKQIMRIIPEGAHAVCALAPVAPAELQEIRLTRDDWQVIQHVYGRRDIRTVARRAGLSEFLTLSSAARLVQANLAVKTQSNGHPGSMK